jgi:hypothetical protein
LQASQALQTVLGLAREAGQYFQPGKSEEEQRVEFAKREEAISLCEQILTVAVPIARFRCFVTVEQVSPKAKIGLGDFAISGLDISSIKNGLIGLSMEYCNVYIQLWEHREEGKFDMLCGYQGQTKNLGFRNWLKDIDRHQAEKQTNNVQMPNVPPAR